MQMKWLRVYSTHANVFLRDASDEAPLTRPMVEPRVVASFVGGWVGNLHTRRREIQHTCKHNQLSG